MNATIGAPLPTRSIGHRAYDHICRWPRPREPSFVEVGGAWAHGMVARRLGVVSSRWSEPTRRPHAFPDQFEPIVESGVPSRMRAARR